MNLIDLRLLLQCQKWHEDVSLVSLDDAQPFDDIYLQLHLGAQNAMSQ